MGTIVERRRNRGGIAYMAKIIMRREGKVILRESRTFETRPAASRWMAIREGELAEPGAVARANIDNPTLATAIDRYIDESRKAIGKTKAQVLEAIKAHPIADKRCAQIASDDLVDYAKFLGKARKPQTVGNYISHLGAVFTVARPAWAYPLDSRAMDDARIVMTKLGLIAKSGERDRRPTLDELDRIMRHFETRSIRKPSSSPMVRITAFAIFSTRRQEEITRIAWSDLDEAHSRVLVRNMKNPGEKIGNDVWCDLPPEALAIIKATPRSHAEIFPYGTDGISAAFTRACAFLGIEDLHFHDLRHDGVSRLFELGWNIPHVAAVSGHRSWQSLKRYTHIKQAGDKYTGWRWLEAATTPPQPSRKLPRAPDSAPP